jgi:hypothetical protein
MTIGTPTTKNDTLEFEITDTAIDGLGGTDTLLFNQTDATLTGTALTSIEILKAGLSTNTTFLVDQGDLAAKGSVVGHTSGTDTLTIVGTSFDLRSTTLTSVEKLVADATLGAGKSVTFKLDQADLAANGSVIGTTESADALVINGASLDLAKTSTTLTDVEFLEAGTSKATTFTLTAAQLADVEGISGSSGADTLTVKGDLDFGTRDLDSIETLKAGNSTATAFTVQDSDLKANSGDIVTITGSSGSDSLSVVGTAFDLTSTKLTSVESLVATDNGTVGTVFTLDQADIAKNGAITGSSSSIHDELVINGVSLDLSSTNLSDVETLTAGASKATTFTVDAADLTDVTAINGTKGGTDSLIVKTGTTVDLSGTDLGSVEILKALATSGVSFTVDESDLAGNGGAVAQIVGAKGIDSLTVVGTAFNLTDTTLTSIEQLITDNTTTNGTVFRIDQADLAKGGSVTGSSNGDDELVANGSSLDLTSTTLTDVENLSGGGNNLFTITGTQLADLDKIEDGSGGGTLVVKGSNGTTFDVSGLTSLDGIATLKAGLASATTFTVDESQLGFNGADAITAIVGSSGSDILQVVGTNFNLDGTTLTSVEQLVATNNGTNSTTFTLDQADLAKGGSVVGSTATADEILANGSALDLSSTSINSIELLQANAGGTVFTLTGAEFVAVGDINGDASDDVLVLKTTDFNLGLGADLSSIEELRAGVAGATTFVVATTDLVSGGGDVDTITGSSGADTLTVNGTDFDLTGVTLNSVEKLVGQTGLGAVTFTLEDTLLSTKTTIVGTTNTTDTIVAAGSSLDLRSTTLSSVEELKAGLTTGTTFTITSAQLGGLKISGDALGDDTLKIASNNYDLSSTSLSSIEILAGSVVSTTFKLNQGDLAAGGSVQGSSGTDTIIAVDTQLDLSSTTLTSIEKLQAGNAGDTTFTVNQADLASKGSVVGGKGTDSLVTADAGLDLTSTTLSSIEVLAAGTTADTTFTVDQADLAKGGSVEGNSGDDTLVVLGNAINLTSTTLNSVEALESSSSKATTFTLDAGDLLSLQSITGNIGASDTLIVTGSTTIDLGGVTVSEIEALKVSGTADTTIILQGSGGFASITGTSKTDTLETSTTALDLTNTTLSGIEKLQAGNVAATTFTVDQADLASKGSVIGSSGNDTLQIAGTSLDLRSTTLNSVEVLKAGNALATTFTVDSADLASGGSVIGSSGTDTLIVADTAFDLSSTTLTSVETLKAGSAKDTTFTVNQGDLANGGSVIGSTGKDTLASADATLDLTSTTLFSVEVLQSAAGGTAFKVDQGDLANKGSVVGSTSATDTLTIVGTSFDVTSSALSSVEVLTGGSSNATTFKVDQEDLAENGSVVGSSGTDTLITNGTALDLSSTALTSVEILQAGTSKGTTFTIDQSDLAVGGSVNGSSGSDKLVSTTTAADLTSTTLSSIEVLATAATGALGTTFTVDANDLAAGGSVIGNSNAADDTLVVKDVAINLTSTTLTSIEVLKAGLSTATTFTVDQADLAASGSVIGSTGTDTLAINGSKLDLTGTTLTSVEVLTTALTGTVGTTFIVDDEFGSVTSVVGNSNASDTLQANSSIDLTSATLTDIAAITIGVTGNTTLTVDMADITNRSVTGNAGTDTLQVKDVAIDLTSTTLSSIDVLKAGLSSATTFTVDQGDLAAGGSVIGSTGTDALVINGSSLDLTSTTLTSIESLEAGNSGGTTFTVDKNDLVSGGSVIGVSGSASIDTLVVKDSTIDLTSTTLTDVEVLKTGLTGTDGTTFTVDALDLAAGGSVIGNASSNSDQLVVKDSDIDLTSTTLTSIEQLKAGTTDATTFTVDQDDLAAGGSVTGTTNTADALVINGATLDLTSTSLDSIESLEAGTVSGTTFNVDQSDLDDVTAVKGSTGTDTLAVNGTALDLTSATLTSVEILTTLLTGSLGTTFTVDKADLVAGGSVIGNSNSSAIDTLVSTSTDFDLSATTLSSVEVLQTNNSGNTTFKVDQADLAAGGLVIGHTGGTDTLLAVGVSLDLSSTSLTSVEILKAGNASATTFTVDQDDLASGGQVIGSTGNDTLLTHASALDLTSTTLTSVEFLKSDNAAGTTFTVNLDDIDNGAAVVGHSSAIDTLVIKDTAIDLTSTTLTNIEHLTAGSTDATTFTLDQTDLNSMGSEGLISGHTGVSDTLIVDGTTDVYLASTTLSSIETIETSDQTVATHFTVSNGQAGATIELSANTVDDTITLESGYQLGSSGIADSDAVLAHTVAINDFEVGASSDVLDLSNLALHGTATVNDISGYISLVNPGSLKDALDIAAAGVSGASHNTSVVTFEYGGDTYVLVDNSDSKTLTADDTVIKLVGVTTALDSSNINLVP